MIKLKLTQSAVVIYTTCEGIQNNVRTRIDEYGNVNKTKSIGQRGRMLIKRYSRLLSQCIFEKRTEEKVLKKPYSQQLNFITLTLPSKQKHSDKEIYRTCLMPFIQEMVNKKIFTNYIWRAEIQKNGNIHYHLITDGFPTWQIIRECWNRNTEKLGYVTNYSNRMKSLTYDQYFSIRIAEKNMTKEKVYQAFQKGCESGWSSPNSTDFEVVGSSEGLENYLSKYLAKETEEDARVLDGRHWGCSDMVRKLVDTVTEISPKELCAVKGFAKGLNIREIDYDYAMIYVGSHADLRQMCDVVLDRIDAIIASNSNFLYGKFKGQMHFIDDKKIQIADEFDLEILAQMSKDSIN